jgi:hypothetical protein
MGFSCPDFTTLEGPEKPGAEEMDEKEGGGTEKSQVFLRFCR